MPTKLTTEQQSIIDQIKPLTIGVSNDQQALKVLNFNYRVYLSCLLDPNIEFSLSEEAIETFLNNLPPAWVVKIFNYSVNFKSHSANVVIYVSAFIIQETQSSNNRLLAKATHHYHEFIVSALLDLSEQQPLHTQYHITQLISNWQLIPELLCSHDQLRHLDTGRLLNILKRIGIKFTYKLLLLTQIFSTGMLHSLHQTCKSIVDQRDPNDPPPSKTHDSASKSMIIEKFYQDLHSNIPLNPTMDIHFIIDNWEAYVALLKQDLKMLPVYLNHAVEIAISLQRDDLQIALWKKMSSKILIKSTEYRRAYAKLLPNAPYTDEGYLSDESIDDPFEAEEDEQPSVKEPLPNNSIDGDLDTDSSTATFKCRITSTAMPTQQKQQTKSPTTVTTHIPPQPTSPNPRC